MPCRSPLTPSAFLMARSHRQSVSIYPCDRPLRPLTTSMSWRLNQRGLSSTDSLSVALLWRAASLVAWHLAETKARRSGRRRTCLTYVFVHGSAADVLPQRVILHIKTTCAKELRSQQNASMEFRPPGRCRRFPKRLHGYCLAVPPAALHSSQRPRAGCIQ